MSRSTNSVGRDTARAVSAAHDLFIAGEVDAGYLESAALRPLVAQSWQRSLATGVDPDGAARAAAIAARVAEMRDSHQLAPALPVIRRLLVEDATDAGVVVAVAGADGTLLWVEGDHDVRRKMEPINFVPGADWSERGAGTNAPGTALALNSELQIRGSEHFSRLVQPWSCTAVPIHDPVTGEVLGAIDVSGGAQTASPQTLALVRATAVAVENHLALLRLTQPTATELPAAPRLTVLGADRPAWHVTDEHGGRHAATLTGRHAEILLLLSRHPEGVSADHLAILLDDKDLDAVTIRAEMSRLRRVIGATFIASRPYRLLEPITSDAGEVFDALRTGDVAGALAKYTGELLPLSVSPAIGRLRTELSTGLRAAVLATHDLTLLRRWLELPEARDDRHGWRSLHDRAPAGSVERARARGHLAGLDRDLL